MKPAEEFLYNIYIGTRGVGTTPRTSTSRPALQTPLMTAEVKFPLGSRGSHPTTMLSLARAFPLSISCLTWAYAYISMNSLVMNPSFRNVSCGVKPVTSEEVVFTSHRIPSVPCKRNPLVTRDFFESDFELRLGGNSDKP